MINRIKINWTLNKKQIFFVVFGVIVISLISSYFLFFKSYESAEAGWWDEGWYYRKALVVDYTKVDSELTNFPVAVQFNTTNNIYNNTNSDGSDLRFTDSNGNILKYEIEKWNESGTSTVWVKVPTIYSNASTTFYIYYGNPTATDAQTPTEVWDDDFAAVYHLSETSGHHFDSTKNGNNTNSTNAETQGSYAGVLDGADFFNGTNNYLQVPYHISLDIIKKTPTISMWVRPENNASKFYNVIIGTGLNEELATIFVNDSRNLCIWQFTDHICSSFQFATGTWTHVVAEMTTYTNTNLYINGQYHSSINSAWGRDWGNNDSYYLTMAARPGFATYYHGALDEIRIYNTVRSAAWHKASYENGSNNLITIATEEKGPGPVAYWSFDEGYGTTANDYSTGGNHGAISGATWKDETECVKGKCLYFDGSNDVVTISNTTNITSYNNSRSVSLWFKTITLGSQKGIITTGDVVLEDSPLWLFVHSETANDLAVYHNGYKDTETILETNKWYHAVYTYDADSDELNIYLNGRLEYSGVHSDAANDNANIFIGGGWYDYFNGFIDEVKIYNYARTADQVKQDYNKGFATYFGSDESYLSDGLVGYWPMDENASGTCAIVNYDTCDLSGNGNDGNWNGSVTPTSTAKFGRALSFSGADDSFVPLDNGSSLANLYISSFTVSAWFKSDNSAAGLKGVLGTSHSLDFIRIYVSEGQVLAQTYINGDVDKFKNLSSPANYIISDTWYQVTVTRNNITGDIILYLNGDKVDSVNAFGTIGGYQSILSISHFSNQSFNGEIDEMRIYNRALSPDEVRRLYEWAPGPVLYMPLDENEGTLVYNIAANPTAVSANIATGTLEASMNKNNWVQGKYGSALKFDGVDDWVDIGGTATASLHFDNQTLQFWFNPSIDLNNNGLTRLFDGNYFGIYYDHTTFSGGIDNTLFGFVRDSTGTFRAASSDATVFTANTWYHVAMTYSGNNVYLYVNGIRQTNSTSSYSGIIGTSADDVGFGAGRSGADNFSGIIDDIKIYNYARNQRQVLEDMNGGRQNNPIGYWSFDEGQGGTAYDRGYLATLGSGNNGTLINMTTSGPSSVWSPSGKAGKALQFDGVEDYVTASAGINEFKFGTNDFSTSFYVKYTDAKDYGALVGQGYLANTTGWGFFYNNTGKIYFQTRNGEDISGIASNIPLNDGSWHHIVGRRENGTIKMYVDGILQTDTNSTVRDLSGGDGVFSVGVRNQGTSQFYYSQATIDEVKVYNYPITFDEIRQNLNVGLQNQLSSNLESQKTDGLINHGTAGGNANTTSTAKYGRAGVFDGDSDYINAGTDSSLEVQAHTLSAWIRPASITYGAAGIIASKSDNIGNAGLEWGLHGTSGDLAFAYNDGSLGDWYISTNSNLQVDNWYHVAFVWRQNDGQMDFYVNGQKTDTKDTTSSHTAGNPVVYASDNFLIGYQPNNSYFNGEIDDVKLYNTARTPEQIMRDYVEGPPPVAYWKFDDMSGTSAVDSSGNGNTGTLGGGEGASRIPNWDVDGKKGGTLDFDGDDDYVKLLNDFDSANLSISLWFNGDDITGRQLVGHRSITYSSLKRGSDTIISLRTSENVIRSFTVPTMSPNTWYHLVTTRENGVFRVYLNGIESTTGGITDNGDFEINAIGLYQGGQEFDGTIDEVKFYDYALTLRQIVQEYNTGAPLGYWSFDEGEGETVFDRSGNGNNGTLVVGSGGTQTTTSTAWTNGVTGKINSSLNYDGTDDRVNLGSVTTGENVTISAWIKTSTSSPEVPIFSNRGSGVYFGIASGKLFIYDNSASPSPGMTSNASVNDNNWHHLVWTSNGSSSIMYIDGEFDSRQAQSRGADTGTAYIAWDASNAVEWFPGQIDEVKIWNYPLTPAEIKNEYNGGFSSFFR